MFEIFLVIPHCAWGSVLFSSAGFKQKIFTFHSSQTEMLS